MAKSIKEYKEENSTLKKLVSDLKDALSRASGKEVKPGSYNEIGMSVVKQGDSFKLVKLSFDLKENIAKIDSVEDIWKNPKDFSVMVMKAKEYLIKEIIGKL